MPPRKIDADKEPAPERKVIGHRPCTPGRCPCCGYHGYEPVDNPYACIQAKLFHHIGYYKPGERRTAQRVLEPGTELKVAKLKTVYYQADDLRIMREVAAPQDKIFTAQEIATAKAKFQDLARGLVGRQRPGDRIMAARMREPGEEG